LPENLIPVFAAGPVGQDLALYHVIMTC